MSESSDEKTEKNGASAVQSGIRAGAPSPEADPEIAVAEAAAACILWRRIDPSSQPDPPAREGSDIEVYLVQRAASLAFMGGYWAFPGGRVEASDGSPRHAARRELLEETGVVVGERELVEAGRWITPRFSPIRFDARYYLVDGTGTSPEAGHSGGELSAGRWVSPERALAAWRHADWLIAPPVAHTLAALAAGLSGAAERCQEAAERARGHDRIGIIAPAVAICPLRTPTLPPATHTNCYLVGDREVVLVDPGSPYPDQQRVLDDVLAALRGEGRRVVAIWLTHHHRDHCADAARLRDRLGVPVAAHPATAERLRGTIPIDRMLADGERLALAGDPPRRLRVLHTPGHAPGHCCLVEEHTGIVLAGDLVASQGTIVIDPDDGDMARYLDSLALVRRLSPRLLLPAHGALIAAPTELLTGYIEHRLWREARVEAALAARGRARAVDLVPDVYDDVPPPLHRLAERSLIAHLHKLVADGRAARAGDEWLAISSD